MNEEDCRVLLERSSRPLRPTRPAARPVALVRSFVRSFVRSLARSLVRSFVRSFVCSFVRARAPQPLAENPYDDTMSGVPTTEKCLLPRVVMRCPLLRVREGLPLASLQGGSRGYLTDLRAKPDYPNHPLIGRDPPIGVLLRFHWITFRMVERLFGVAPRCSPPRRW